MAKTRTHIDPEKIHLSGIEKVAIKHDSLEKELKSKKDIKIRFAHLSGFNLDDQRYLLGLKAVFELSESSSTEPKRYVFRYNFHFKVDNLEEMYEIREDGSPFFKKLFVATLAGISYSTLRGIVFEKSSESDWGPLILPVVNPSKLLESWIEQD